MVKNIHTFEGSTVPVDGHALCHALVFIKNEITWHRAYVA